MSPEIIKEAPFRHLLLGPCHGEARHESSRLFSSDEIGGKNNEHACAAGAVRHRHGERRAAILRADSVLPSTWRFYPYTGCWMRR